MIFRLTFTDKQELRKQYDEYHSVHFAWFPTKTVEGVWVWLAPYYKVYGAGRSYTQFVECIHAFLPTFGSNGIQLTSNELKVIKKLITERAKR